MTKVYMFSMESIQEDLYLRGVGEIEIETITSNIKAELQISKAIIINDIFVVGYGAASSISQRYGINVYGQILF